MYTRRRFSKITLESLPAPNELPPINSFGGRPAPLTPPSPASEPRVAPRQVAAPQHASAPAPQPPVTPPTPPPAPPAQLPAAPPVTSRQPSSAAPAPQPSSDFVDADTAMLAARLIKKATSYLGKTIGPKYLLDDEIANDDGLPEGDNEEEDNGADEDDASRVSGFVAIQSRKPDDSNPDKKTANCASDDERMEDDHEEEVTEHSSSRRRPVRPHRLSPTRPHPTRHSRKCRVCRHPDREDIEFEFIRWENVARITDRYDLGDRFVIYRHAHALNLFERRARNVSHVLEHLMEDATCILATPDSILRAVRAYACITDHIKWVEPPTTHLFVPKPDGATSICPSAATITSRQEALPPGARVSGFGAIPSRESDDSNPDKKIAGSSPRTIDVSPATRKIAEVARKPKHAPLEKSSRGAALRRNGARIRCRKTSSKT